jgi:adhesin transport system outer membrane protein
VLVSFAMLGSACPTLLGAQSPLTPPAPAPAAPPPPALPSVTPSLPEAGGEPMQIDPTNDPVLAISRAAGSVEAFRTLVQAAVARSPSVEETIARGDEARAARSEARARLYPSVDAQISSYKTFARKFSNDPQNIIERSRAESRTDVQVTVTQTVLDFGAGSMRIASAGARLRSAAAELDYTVDQSALSAIAAWYDVFSFRALVSLGESFTASQRDLREAVVERVRLGVSAEGDVARVDSYIASADTRLARSRRSLAQAEARFTEAFGHPPPERLERAPVLQSNPISKDMATYLSQRTPGVIATNLQAEAARQDARAAHAENLPNLSASVDAGRYGLLETYRTDPDGTGPLASRSKNNSDYDVRGRLTLRKRFFGGIDSRVDQAEARAGSAAARADRFREEAMRDASIAWTDVQTLEEQLRALDQSYIASRRSRDVLVERFRVQRGTLFDVLGAEDSYFDSASAYIQAVTELDAARYVLLSRTGRLLDSLSIAPAEESIK